MEETRSKRGVGEFAAPWVDPGVPPARQGSSLLGVARGEKNVSEGGLGGVKVTRATVIEAALSRRFPPELRSPPTETNGKKKSRRRRRGGHEMIRRL